MTRTELTAEGSLLWESHLPSHLHSQMTAQPVERYRFPVHHVAPVSSLSVITQPVATQPGQPFSQQPAVQAVDSNVSSN